MPGFKRPLPDQSFKPTLLRGIGKASQDSGIAAAAKRCGLTQASDRMSYLTASYLRDPGSLLREGWEASERSLASAAPEQRQYEAGYNRACRRVLLLMLQQAEAFNLPASATGLEGIDRDKELGC